MMNKIRAYLSFLLITFISFGSKVLAFEPSSSDVVVKGSALDVSTTCKDVIPSSLIDMIKELWLYIVIIAPILFVITTLLDIAKAIGSSDGEAFKGLFKKEIKKLIAVIVIIMLPIIINFILGLINSNLSTCIN